MKQSSSNYMIDKASLADFGYSRQSQGTCVTLTIDEVRRIRNGITFYMPGEELDDLERYLLGCS